MAGTPTCQRFCIYERYGRPDWARNAVCGVYALPRDATLCWDDYQYDLPPEASPAATADPNRAQAIHSGTLLVCLVDGSAKCELVDQRFDVAKRPEPGRRANFG